ncbi:ABC transporter permease [Telluribacter sp.]|jgi:ABC-type antimicrobial peptide transport system permease subunit|uniref:ABC transporter permease n=1 Tax=Telluribacter sp. TaxID=1978767 RepID=UPI002E122C16|nr:ABC transporter permease [Telluribacter sp.]
MLRNYLKIAFRNLVKNKVYSFINIAGLAVGMAVALLISLWVWDEVSFNTYHQNYGRIVQVMQHIQYNGKKETQADNPYLMADEIRTHYSSDFKYVLQSARTNSLLAYADTKLSKEGRYFEPQVTDMLTLDMVKGTRAGLNEPYAILLSESLANTLFGEEDPLDKTLKLDNETDVRITGVYADLPRNSSFSDMGFIVPWELFLSRNQWIKEIEDPWRPNFTQTYAQLTDKVAIDIVSAKIKDVRLNRVDPVRKKLKPEVFLHPMSKWHLQSKFENGIIAGGRIEYVWLFGIIGFFVLLLACINFMNLSTARSEKRAKEVGIRKAVGSVRSQLVVQFFSESLLVVAIAFVISLLLVQLSLPRFNEVADKKIALPWSSPVFWGIGIGFSLLTGLIAGSYPALYLSSFQPLRVLKGAFRVGRFAAVPRKVLVVAQFTVSVTLIIGTVVVFQQIQYAKNRPVGYDRDGLITIFSNQDIHTHFDAIKNELKSAGAIVEMAESSGPPTDVWSTSTGFEWKGKDPSQAVDFPNTSVSFDYGKTVGWKFKEGRDFSRDFATDSTAIVINEAAAKFMGFEHAVGEVVTKDGVTHLIIGVIADMVMQSPYQPVRASIFHISSEGEAVVMLRLNPDQSSSESLEEIKSVFSTHNPAVPFDYRFVDQEYAKKFGQEERIGKLASFFALLAILISCLGIFGLASFVAEQRTKEIGIRKVLGASVAGLWALLSRDFVILVVISCLVAAPIAYYFLDGWLQKYDYRTTISWWIFAASALGALVITLLTVSFQAIKAALMNPVKSLRTE